MRYVIDYQLRNMCKTRKNYFNQHFEVPTMCVCEAHSGTDIVQLLCTF